VSNNGPEDVSPCAHNHTDHANTNTNYTITSPSGISSPDFTSKLVMAMTTPPASPAQIWSPVASDLGVPFQYQQQRIDEEMKEN